MPVQFKIDFFRVEMPNGSDETFEEVVQRVHDLPEDERRNSVIRGSPTRLQSASFGTRCVEGDLLRIKMNALPPKANLDGDVSPLDLEDDEGLGEETAFLFDTECEVLALQRNRSGASASAFARYFQDVGELDHPIVLLPVLHADAYTKLAGMKEARRLHMRFAGVTNPAVFAGKTANAAVKDIIDLLSYFGAPVADISLSMGRLPGSLIIEKIRTLYNWLVGSASSDGGEVTKLEISGVTEDDERSVFDLLSYRMTETAEVDENSKRRTTYTRRRPVLHAAWERRREELETLFG